MLIGEITVSQRFFVAVLHLPGGFLQLYFLQLSDYNSGFFPGGLFVFLRMDGLEHLGNQLYLGMRNNRKHISVKVRSCTNK